MCSSVKPTDWVNSSSSDVKNNVLRNALSMSIPEILRIRAHGAFRQFLTSYSPMTIIPYHILRRIVMPLLAVGAVAFLAGCSTTKAIPDDEQLYTGIKRITYTDDPSRARHKGGRDSVGVITAVGNAVEAVSEVLRGGGTKSVTDMLAANKKELTKAERKTQKEAQKRAEADFATAKEEVEAVLAYPPNNALFGSSYYHSPLQIGLWIHNSFAGSEEGLGKWLFNHFGTEPVLVSNVSPEMRAKVATNTLHNYGYFHGKVGYDVLTNKSNKKKAKVSYDVHAGQLYRLDSIAYMHFPTAMDSMLTAHMDERLLHRGDAFSVVNLSNEQTRIESMLRENGYYYYNAAYITFRADTIIRPGKVQLMVLPVDNRPEVSDHPWYIGNTYVNVRRNDQAPLDNMLEDKDYTFQFSGRKLPLRASMWRHAVAHRKGEIYRLSDQKMTLSKLGELGVLSQMDVSYVPRDTTAGCDTLDVMLSAVMDKLYDSTFEVNATMKSNQQVGPGISYELAKRNAFRGAEKVSFKVFGSYEWQTGAGAQGGNSLLNSYELGTQLAFKYPRFMFPFISRRHLRFPANTQFALDADWKNRSKFYNMVSMGLSVTYDWYKRKQMKHSLTLFSLDFDKLNHTTAAFDSIMSANPALYMSMRNQFVPSLSYTMTYQSANSKRNPWWVQLTAKEAGNITSALYAAAGQRFDAKNKNLLGNPFAQFVKFTAEMHKMVKITPNVNLATRLFGGVIWAYGNSSSAPYADQFYVGGANSIRAFTVRSLGPGAYRAPNSKYSYMDQTGDIKLEANAELRARLFGDLHGAVFLDAGNVWLMHDDPKRPDARLSASTIKHIALGTGVGLRYDLDFLVLRFDVGIALHAPYATSKSGFYNIEKFKDGLGLHFAIGYPF